MEGYLDKLDGCDYTMWGDDNGNNDNADSSNVEECCEEWNDDSNWSDLDTEGDYEMNGGGRDEIGVEGSHKMAVGICVNIVGRGWNIDFWCVCIAEYGLVNKWQPMFGLCELFQWQLTGSSGVMDGIALSAIPMSIIPWQAIDL